MKPSDNNNLIAVVLPFGGEYPFRQMNLSKARGLMLFKLRNTWNDECNNDCKCRISIHHKNWN